jgi:DNA-binding LacI/PurR family transcriptional regulator
VGKVESRSRAPARRPTPRDVAAAAGVSRAPISYVLGGADEKQRITPAIRDRVLAVAQRLGRGERRRAATA